MDGHYQWRGKFSLEGASKRRSKKCYECLKLPDFTSIRTGDAVIIDNHDGDDFVAVVECLYDSDEAINNKRAIVEWYMRKQELSALAELRMPTVAHKRELFLFKKPKSSLVETDIDAETIIGKCVVDCIHTDVALPEKTSQSGLPFYFSRWAYDGRDFSPIFSDDVANIRSTVKTPKLDRMRSFTRDSSGESDGESVTSRDSSKTPSKRKMVNKAKLSRSEPQGKVKKFPQQRSTTNLSNMDVEEALELFFSSGDEFTPTSKARSKSRKSMVKNLHFRKDDIFDLDLDMTIYDTVKGRNKSEVNSLQKTKPDNGEVARVPKLKISLTPKPTSRVVTERGPETPMRRRSARVTLPQSCPPLPRGGGKQTSKEPGVSNRRRSKKLVYEKENDADSESSSSDEEENLGKNRRRDGPRRDVKGRNERILTTPKTTSKVTTKARRDTPRTGAVRSKAPQSCPPVSTSGRRSTGQGVSKRRINFAAIKEEVEVEAGEESDESCDDNFGSKRRSTSRQKAPQSCPPTCPSRRSSAGRGTSKKQINFAPIKEEDEAWRGSDDSSDEDFETKRRRTPKANPKRKGTATPKNKCSARAATPQIHARKTPRKTPSKPLEQARVRLHVSAVPTSLPCREDEFADIFSFVKGHLLDKLWGCLYVSGVPGTGKTATVHAMLEELNAEVQEGSLPPFQTIEINGMRLTEPHQAFVQILKHLTGQKATPQHAATILEQYFTSSRQKSKPVVLIVDELDLLWTRKQDVLYSIFDWPTKPRSGLIVVAIANTMDLPERIMMNRVSSRLGLSRMTFQPYTFKQLQEIVEVRLHGLRAFDSEAIQLAARKVAALSGDARRALDICRRATEIAEANQKKGSKGTVGLSHVEMAVSEMFCSPKIMAIRKASKQEQIFMRALISEFRQTGLEETTFEEVLKQHVSLCRLQGFPPPSVSEIWSVCVRLAASKLLLLEAGFNEIGKRILLNVSQDDVRFALSQSER